MLCAAPVRLHVLRDQRWERLEIDRLDEARREAGLLGAILRRGSLKPVTATSSARDPCSRMRRATSNPVMSGRPMSTRINEGVHRAD